MLWKKERQQGGGDQECWAGSGQVAVLNGVCRESV